MVGLALKGALGEAGGDLFAAWSAQSGKDDAVFTAKTWAGLKAERIGAGTIYHLAMERGWKPDPALVLDGDAPRDTVHPAAGLLARVQVAPTSPPGYEYALSVIAWRLNGRQVHHRRGRRFVIARAQG